MEADRERAQMTAQNDTRLTSMRLIIVRLLDSIALLVTASAGVIVFVAIPFDLLDSGHLLPNWSVFTVLLFTLAPNIIAWGHAGIYIALIVVVVKFAHDSFIL
jgi:hypothetical protein